MLHLAATQMAIVRLLRKADNVSLASGVMRICRQTLQLEVPDEVAADFKLFFAGEATDAIMTALLKRAIFVRRFYDSDDAMLAALCDGSIQFAPLRVR